METRKNKYRAYRVQIKSMADEEFPQAEGNLEGKQTPYSALEEALSSSFMPSKQGLYDKYLRQNRKRLLIKLIIFGVLLIALLIWYFVGIR